MALTCEPNEEINSIRSELLSATIDNLFDCFRSNQKNTTFKEAERVNAIINHKLISIFILHTNLSFILQNGSIFLYSTFHVVTNLTIHLNDFSLKMDHLRPSMNVHRIAQRTMQEILT